LTKAAPFCGARFLRVPNSLVLLERNPKLKFPERLHKNRNKSQVEKSRSTGRMEKNAHKLILTSIYREEKRSLTCSIPILNIKNHFLLKIMLRIFFLFELEVFN